jgi:hypothetical protein
MLFKNMRREYTPSDSPELVSVNLALIGWPGAAV